MVSRGELIEHFGSDGVATASEIKGLRSTSAATDLELLRTVGIPLHVDRILSLESGTPEAFSVFPVSTTDGDLDLLVLGSPSIKSAMRYLLDTKDGYVVLLDLESQQPALEVVNESLSNFMEYVYRIARYQSFRENVAENGVAIADYKELLSTYLVSMDSFAFAKTTNWWSMVFDRVL
ncbi:SUKH-4 family immunity protein [Streptomyces sp. SCSIO ZS0520]|uniref:SUKH-4 family immunity protein n=1 Tax=Streptomyces sp. SCSIO ZS0520 TaxID=2892996 RepID=UPI0021D94150|nr:SUKH-4 family immunity protein [Streptomyces sp. SCSIO ZS0520]